MGAIEAGLGLILGGINDKRQVKQQGKLQKQQIAGQKEMGLYNQGLAKDMWDYTNYENQVKHMKNAGVNPALLYGGGGGGGATTNTPTGSVSGASAPVGGGEMGMALQMGMMDAQKKLLEAQANNLNVDSAKKAGADTENVMTDTAVKKQSIENLKQDVKTKEAQQALTNIQTKSEEIRYQIASATIEDAISDVKWGVRQTIGLANQAEAKGWVDKATTNEAIGIVKADYAGALLNNIKTKTENEKLKAQITEIEEGIKQGWKGLEQKDIDLKIKTFSEEMKAAYPSMSESIGFIINELLANVNDVQGEGREIKPATRIK